MGTYWDLWLRGQRDSPMCPFLGGAGPAIAVEVSGWSSGGVKVHFQWVRLSNRTIPIRILSN